MNFLQKVRGLTLFDKVESTDIRQSFNIERQLLRIEQSQLRWYGHVTQKYHARTAKQLMDALPSGKRPKGRPRTRWLKTWHAQDLAWSSLEIPPA